MSGKLHFEYVNVSDTNTGWADSNSPNYGWVHGLVRGFNIEFKHKETGKIDYNSCVWIEGNIEDYYQKQVDDWGSLGFVLFETERSKGYEPTGRAVFRGYGRAEWNPEECDEFITPIDINEYIELCNLVPNPTIDPHASISENARKIFRIFNEPWRCIDDKKFNGTRLFLLEHDRLRDENARIIVDFEENIVAEDVHDFSDYERMLPWADKTKECTDEDIARLQEYIEENFSLNRTSRGLVQDILQFAKQQGEDTETTINILSALLYSLGVEKEEIEDVLCGREVEKER